MRVAARFSAARSSHFVTASTFGVWRAQAHQGYSSLSPPSHEQARMLDDSQQQAIVTRLNRIEGQVRGIRRMVQEPRLCVEILQQLSAAEAALNRISLAVFKFHVERCVPEGITKGEPERGKQLTELVDIFDRFAK
jgi:CsoR family transcriptional regulator, copper-sensing transcriptional repressor